ncbi:PadR family transcriptional regulator [Microbispora sp. RL4-1S]|uniref:PadR family transcriptional regulator n=1 Tax=Microbispora oryzae TaxID=2806554 RepID=A0A940WLD3_9ACTN|nr:PadR family transcriptional regulator [Microbispora oryzae]MBP2703605.1 PadR family transcriptional regulator [Microbispora oryzae]
MAKRRKVNNMLGLAVLATVIERPMHPYEMASLVRARGKDDDMRIKWGSLYTVVRNLEKHGFLEVAGSDKEGGHPERTIYRITDAGRQEYADWVRDLLATPEREQSAFKAALSVWGILTPDEVTSLLRGRVALLEKELADQRAALNGHLSEIPRLFLVEAEYDLAVREAELAWTRSLLGELSEGTFPGLDAWRHWHATGEVPQELHDLFGRGIGAD